MVDASIIPEHQSLYSEQLYNLLFYILEISNELFLFSRNFKKKTMKESIQRKFLTLSSLHQSSVHQYNQVSLVQVVLSSRLCHRMYLPVLSEVKQNIWITGTVVYKILPLSYKRLSTINTRAALIGPYKSKNYDFKIQSNIIKNILIAKVQTSFWDVK